MLVSLLVLADTVDLLRWKVSLALVGEYLNDAKSFFVKACEVGLVGEEAPTLFPYLDLLLLML